MLRLFHLGNRFVELMMTIEKQIAAIERDIYWNAHVARQSKDNVQKERCIKRIDDFLLMLRELMDMKQDINGKVQS